MDSLEAIDARIAELKQRIAEKHAYEKMYRPNRSGALFDAIMGNPQYLNKIDSEHAAYQNMLRQQEQQAELQKAQMLNSQEIAKANQIDSSNSNALQIQKEFDFAQIELDAAKENLDKDNPDSVAAYKKAVKKANYWGSQLPEGYGYEPIVINDDEITDSKRVRIKKKVDSAKALMIRKGLNWDDESVSKAEAFAMDPEIPEETRLQLMSELANKGEGAETKAKNWAERKKQLLDKYNKMNPNQKRVWKKNNPKTAKAIGV